MFHLKLLLSDCMKAPHIFAKSIVWENSKLDLFPHDVVRVNVFRMEQDYCIVIREECASAPAFMRKADEAWREGRIVVCSDFTPIYEAFHDYPGEIFLIETASGAHGCCVRICAGARGICPVYFSVSQGSLDMSWDFGTVVKTRSAPSVDMQYLLRSLHQNFYSSQTAFQHVTMLPRNGILQWDGNSIHLSSIEDMLDVETCATDTGETPHAAFSSLLETELETRLHPHNEIALELSGGIDSGIVAAFMGQKGGADLMSLGIIVNDERLSGSQQKRREHIVSRYRLMDFTASIGDYLPDFTLQRSDLDYGLPAPELQIKAFAPLWHHARDNGRKYIYAGLGGDELFPCYPEDPVPDFMMASIGGIPPFNELQDFFLSCLTQKGREQALDEMPVIPTDPADVSSLIGMQRHTPLAMRAGLWPVYPLASPALRQFCHALPFHLRRGKRLAVDILGSLLADATVFDGYPKENFSAALHAGIVQHQERLKQSLRSSPLVDLGIVDPARMEKNLAFCVLPENAFYSGHLGIFFYLDRFLRS